MTLCEFEQQLIQSSDLSALNRALSAYLKQLKIITFAFTYYAYHPNSQNKLKYDYASESFRCWHQHYLGESYEENDSTLDEAYRCTQPIFWDLQEQLKNAKTSREKQMRLDSLEFGARSGLSIPIHGPSEDFAILLLVQMRGETCLKHWQEKKHDLFSVAYIYYHHLQKHLVASQSGNEKYQLTPREVQCLHFLASNASVAEIAVSLNITERTVNFHIQRINKKLGVKNKHQSVAKALEKGLLTI